MSALAERVCVGLARLLANRAALRTPDYDRRMFDRAAYQGWRTREMETQFRDNFDLRLVVGRDVLDFGCGTGGLAIFLAGSGARSVVGVDLKGASLELARAAQQAQAPEAPLVFVESTAPLRIPCPDASVDVITCFDVIEHTMDVDATLREWRRVLRPHGEVLIWWGGGWYSPFAPHIESLIPVPWAHLVFSQRTLVRAAARVYDAPGFRPRVWDVDPATGAKLPNKWRTLTRLPEVNDLTIGRFERKVRRSGFAIVQAEHRGFTSRAARWTAPLVRVPFAREFVTGSMTYHLRTVDA